MIMVLSMLSRNLKEIYYPLLIIFCLGFVCGCATIPSYPSSSDSSKTVDTHSSVKDQKPSILEITPPEEKELVAIAGFENRSTYAADQLWDTASQLLSTNLLDIGYFRVVEWERMKQLFEWRELSFLDIVKTPEKRNKASKILLCDYFISGAVTYFDVSQSSHVSAFSKKKLFETTVRVDLSLQDAQTGEYLGAGDGEWTERQEFEGGMSGGHLGTWNPKSGDKALNYAIREALIKLTRIYDKNVMK